MAVPQDEHERSLAFAEIALEQIRALGQLASPRNFEIWYRYATGYNQPLNQAINEALAKKGALGEADLDQIYDTYIAVSRLGERTIRSTRACLARSSMSWPPLTPPPVRRRAIRNA